MTDTSLWPIVGNERAVRALQNAVASGGVQHAYLFAGTPQVGRATTARILAQALNCTSESPPCRQCAQCKRIAAGIHADVQTVTIEETADDANARKSITTDQVRKVETAVSLSPYEGRTRVVIFDPAEAMSPAAQGAFLKTLEEPPPNVVFILISHDANTLMETIRSRCARVDFSLAPSSQIQAALLDRGASPDQALLFTRLSAGRPGWALAAAANPAIVERRRETLETAQRLPTMTLSDRIDLAERMSDAFKRDRRPTLAALSEWQSWWRDVFLAQTGAEDGIANVDLLDDARQSATLFARQDLVRFLTSLSQIRDLLNQNVQSRIALDALMLDVPTPVAQR